MNKIARSSAACQNVNTLTFHKMIVSLQSFPGCKESDYSRSPLQDTVQSEFNTDADQNIEYAVYINGQYSQSGFSSQDGNIDVFIPAGQKAELRVLGSRYILDPVQKFESVESALGVQQRLTNLGYLPPFPASEECVLAALAKAIADFQIDHQLTLTGLAIDQSTRKVLEEVTSERHIRVAPLAFAQVSSERLDARHISLEQNGFLQAPPFSKVQIPQEDELTDSETELKYIDIPLVGCWSTSMSYNSEAIVDIELSNMDENAPLVAVSSHPELVQFKTTDANSDTSIFETAKGSKRTIAFSSSATNCTQQQSCFITVHLGSETGPVLARLAVILLPLLTVNIQTYHVDVFAQGEIAKSVVDKDEHYLELVAQIKAYWLRYGIELSFAKSKTLHCQLSETNSVSLAELNTVVEAGHRENCINLYLLPNIKAKEIAKPIRALVFNNQEYQGYCFDENTALSKPAVFYNAGIDGTAKEQAIILNQKIAQFIGLESLDTSFTNGELLSDNLMHPSPANNEAKLSLKDLTVSENHTIQSQCLKLRQRILLGPKAIY